MDNIRVCVCVCMEIIFSSSPKYQVFINVYHVDFFKDFFFLDQFGGQTHTHTHTNMSFVSVIMNHHGDKRHTITKMINESTTTIIIIIYH